jgi:hypothetical protein
VFLAQVMTVHRTAWLYLAVHGNAVGHLCCERSERTRDQVCVFIK